MENPIQKEKLESISGLMKLLAAVLIVIIGTKYIATDLIAPILMAMFLAILLMPVFKFYRRKGVSSSWSLLLMVFTLIIIGGGLVLFVTYSFTILRNTLSEYTLQFTASLNQLTSTLGVDQETADEAASFVSPDAILGLLSSILGSLGSLMVYLVIVPILAILLIIQADSIPKSASDKLLKENPGFTKFSKFSSSIMVYVRGRFKVNFATGFFFAISLILIGIDFPFLWGFITIFLSFIPYLGIVIAATPPVLLAFAEYGMWGVAAVILSVAVINILAENVLEPYIQGKGNKVSAAAIVISIVFWGWMLGAVGLILAAPLTVLFKIILADYKETAWIASLIEGDYSKIPTGEEVKQGRFGKAIHGLRSLLPGGNGKKDEESDS